MLRSGLASRSDVSMAPEVATKIKNTSIFWMSIHVVYASIIEAMHVTTAHFSPKLDMQSYPVTLKNGKCPQNITSLS